MQTNSEAIIIADTSCLILLSKIGELELLRLISENVFITNTVKSEFGIQLSYDGRFPRAVWTGKNPHSFGRHLILICIGCGGLLWIWVSHE